MAAMAVPARPPLQMSKGRITPCGMRKAYLYTLVLETEDEVITDCVGIREIHVELGAEYRLTGEGMDFRIRLKPERR